VVAFATITLVNYFLSRRFVFHGSGRSAASEIALTYLVSGLAFVVNLGVTVALIDFADMATMPAKILGTGVPFAWNYLLRQFLVFHCVPPTWRQLRDRLPGSGLS
jgi:putative flippase GtrA